MLPFSILTDTLLRPILWSTAVPAAGNQGLLWRTWNWNAPLGIQFHINMYTWKAAAVKTMNAAAHNPVRRRAQKKMTDENSELYQEGHQLNIKMKTKQPSSFQLKGLRTILIFLYYFWTLLFPVPVSCSLINFNRALFICAQNKNTHLYSSKCTAFWVLL